MVYALLRSGLSTAADPQQPTPMPASAARGVLGGRGRILPSTIIWMQPNFAAGPAALLSAPLPLACLPSAQSVHEHGGYGSVGYGYCWKRSEAQKNLLRTHTTAVSSRMLYKLAQEGFK